MAESNFPSEGDSRFKQTPVQVESENRSSEQLLQIQLDEHQNQDIPDNLQGNNYRDVKLIDNPPSLASPIKSGSFYRGKGQSVNKGQRSPNSLTLQQEKVNPTSVLDNNSGCFQKANGNGAEAASQIIGQLSGTTTKSYPHGSGIVATHYEICFGETQKPKFISDGKTVIVYDPLPRNGLFPPSIVSFTTENGQQNEFDID